MTNDQPKYPDQQYPEQYPADTPVYDQYPPQQYQQHPQYGPPYPQPRQRPLGATILAILEVLAGLGSLALGGIFILVGALLSSDEAIAEIERQAGVTLSEDLLEFGAIAFGALGAVILIAGILFLVLAWAFLKGKSWARFLAIIILALAVVGAVVGAVASFDVVTLGIGIVIPVIILVYLYLPEAKAWFTQ